MTLSALLEQRSTHANSERQARQAADYTATGVHAVQREEFERQIRSEYGDAIDVDFRIALTALRQQDPLYRNMHFRALGSTALSSTRATSFADTFMGALVTAAPLLEVSTVLNTENASELYFSWVAAQSTANGIVTQGSTITPSDPTFGGSTVKGYAYKDLLEYSSEVAGDGVFNFEQWASERLAPLQARKLSDDLWGGNGTTAPQGLLAGLSTVTAGGAAVVAFTDITALIEAVPAAYRYSPNFTILLSGGAHMDLLIEQIAKGSNLMTADTLMGFRMRVDTALTDPATGVKSVAAGDFTEAFLVRVAPLRIDIDTQQGFSTDQRKLRVVTTADSKRMITGAAKALVHP